MNLRDFATEAQKRYLDAIEEHGSQAKAARACGVGKRTLEKALQRLRRSAEVRGYSPEHKMLHSVPESFEVKGVSTYYDVHGEVRGQWVKSQQNREHLVQAIASVLDEKIEQLPQAPEVVEPVATTNSDLLTLYTITDFHYGAYAWAKESGEDWDLEIAKSVLYSTYKLLIDSSPDSEVGIFNQLGDFLHWDGLDAVTPSSGNLLDADTRFSKLVDLSLDSCIHIVNLMLAKHGKVVVFMCEGNHDLASSVWMQKALKKIFHNNPRVVVDDTAFPYYAYKHGDVMLGFHHGHKMKNKSLPSLFSSEPRYRKMWGDSKYTYIHTGHYHQSEQDISEYGGAIVERHPTLAARDAYATRGGYVSYRAARAITYHKYTGEDVRITKTPHKGV